MNITHKLEDYVKEAIAAGKRTLDVVVPHRYVLNLGYAMIEIQPGVRQVTEDIVRHSYSVANGVVAREGEELDESEKPPELKANSEHVQFLQSRGYAIRVIPEAQRFFDNMKSAEAKKGFMADFDTWKNQGLQKAPPVPGVNTVLPAPNPPADDGATTASVAPPTPKTNGRSKKAAQAQQ